ncbi:MAG: cbb3-type cytochrome c oxidase subunit 3 [Alphaproteobacteria bacterium]|nr:cbb3-type cytochrome c oxidase subunit 3 [Alphaproteobacteria bacterium]
MDAESLYALLSSLWVVWFVALFMGIAVWAYWPSKRATFEEIGRIPLRDDE